MTFWWNKQLMARTSCSFHQAISHASLVYVDELNIDYLFFRNLAHNSLTGPLPDLAQMDTLNYVLVTALVVLELLVVDLIPIYTFFQLTDEPTHFVILDRDLSNNTFDPSEAPTWFSTLPSLTTL